ncbi:MAG: CCA tRNA nucleotidyltransferase [Alphaproteobacteria bacterium]
MTSRSTMAGADWLALPQTRALISALDRDVEGGPAIRFVGGCVRNTLMGLKVEDIDVATVHTPEKVMELARNAGFHPVPTGIDHGTITVVVQGKPFEVTTLRIDVKSHGRHADVAYTEDWAADAARRDFTINAIYADADGTLFDPVGGVADVAARRVRFIGDAHARIREDFLRILRFFRFHAWYGQGALDAVGLEACTSEREGLKRLSAERIQKELLRLLEAPDPVPVLRIMGEKGILQILLYSSLYFDLLTEIVAIEEKYLHRADPIRRLSSFVNSEIGERLKFSNADAKRLSLLEFDDAEIDGEQWHLDPDMDSIALGKLLYRYGVERVIDLIVLTWAHQGASNNADKWTRLVSEAKKYVRPKMPINGNDLQALGLSGAKLGEVMKATEAWWADHDFRPDRTALLAKARSLVPSPPVGEGG